LALDPKPPLIRYEHQGELIDIDRKTLGRIVGRGAERETPAA